MSWSVILNGNTWTNAQFDGVAYAVNWSAFFTDVAAHVSQLVNATSTTSLSIGTGSKTLTVTPGKAFAVGQPVVIARTPAPTTSYMDGRVTAYDPVTGSMTVTVVASNGSGTFTDWTISIGGARITGTIPAPVNEGGTGATTISAARVNLGVGTSHDDGTNSLPAIAFSADANTGIYRPGDDTLGLVTGGTARVTIDNAGFVGVGTATPTGRIHSFRGSSGQSTPNTSANGVIIEHSSGAGMSILAPSTSSGTIYFGDETSATAGGLIYSHSNDTLTIRVGDASTITVVGQQLQFNNSGTTSAPALSFTADTNTGIRRTGTDAIAIVVGGVDGLTITKTATDTSTPLIAGRTGTSGGASLVAAPMMNIPTAADAAAVRTILELSSLATTNPSTVGNALVTATDETAARDAIGMYDSVGTFTAPQRGALQSTSYAGSLTLDLSLSNNFDIGALTGNLTLNNPSNQAAGQSGIIFITQDGTGGRTITYGSHWLFEAGVEPALSTGANAKDALFYFVRSNGNIYCTLLRGFA